MTYISKSEFEILSVENKNKYYQRLNDRRNDVYTADDMDALACAYEELGEYGHAIHLALELRNAAKEQRKEDLRYSMERKKKGLLITLVVLASFVLIAAVCSIIAII